MENMNQLGDLLKHEIKDLYSAGEQIIDALPKMIDKATNKDLKQALQQHLEETEKQKGRLDDVLEALNEEGEEEGEGALGLFKGEQKCVAMEGIITTYLPFHPSLIPGISSDSTVTGYFIMLNFLGWRNERRRKVSSFQFQVYIFLLLLENHCYLLESDLDELTSPALRINILNQKLKPMKKFLIVASTGLICFLISCNNSTGGNAQGEKNIATVHAVDDAIESGDVSKLDQYIAADGVDHTGEHGEVKGLDNIKAGLKEMHDSYKDMKLEELQDAASGDYVFTLSRFTGTSTKESMGAPAGTSFDMTSVEVAKFNSDGKATDHWSYFTMADAMKMMGGGNNMGMGNKMDTTMNKMDTTKH